MQRYSLVHGSLRVISRNSTQGDHRFKRVTIQRARVVTSTERSTSPALLDNGKRLRNTRPEQGSADKAVASDPSAFAEVPW